MINIRSYSSDQVTTQTQAALFHALETSQKHPVLLMLSGGSSLKLLDNFDTSLLGEYLTITVLDERFSAEPEVNNWLQVTQTEFYQAAVTAGCSFIETVPEPQESLAQFAQRWEDALRHWVKHHAKRTTIATVGIGADGHIAGISPFPDQPERFVEFLFTDRWVKGYSGNLVPADRVTVTTKFLEKKLDQAIVYAVGDSKRSALEAVLSESGRMADTPARILREMKSVEIFTDQKL